MNKITLKIDNEFRTFDKDILMQRFNNESIDDLELLIERELNIKNAIDEYYRIYNEKLEQKKYNLFIAINKL
jgi:hypothetical protein